MPLSPRTLRPANTFTPRSISGLALWLDASASGDLYTTDAGPVVPVSSPTEISGCALWLDGDQSVTPSVFDATSGGSAVTANGASIARWQDKSVNGRHFIQSTPTLRPTLTTSGRNGRSVVTFDATDDFMQSASTQNIPQPATWIIVYKTPSSLASGWSLCDSTTDRVHVYSTGPDVRMFAGGTQFVAEATVSADQWRVGTYFFNGASSSGRRDGSQSAAGTTGTNGATGTIMLGANNGGAATLKSQIAEAILLTGVTSFADIARVEAYLAAKWGISGVHAAATSANDPVGYWRDRSGNGRHAVQATGANRPAVGSAVSNGRRGVNFGTAGNSQRLGWLPSSGTQDWREVIAVAVYDRSASTFADVETLFSGYNTNSGTSLGIGLSGEPANMFTSQYGTFLPETNINALGHVATSLVRPFPAISSPFVVIARATSAVTPVAVAGYVVGNDRQFSPNRNWRGRMAEVIAFERALTASERNRIVRYLAAKYGIVLAPQVSNADAQDWVNRVYANGGTVSAATAAAVNQFCLDIENAPGGSLRDRFYRLNLFCGTGINACLVPLYRGQSLGGAQFGGATDTNVGPFVSGDYVETGSVSGGLTSSGSQYLNTGFATNLLAEGNRHLAAYEITRSAANFKYYLGSEYASGGGAGQFLLGYHGSATTRRFGFGAFGSDLQSPTATAGGFWMGVNHATATGTIYRNGTLDISGGATGTAVPEATNIFVFGANRANGLAGGYAGRLGGYSIGLSMTAPQAAAYSTAMQAFQTALQRNT